MATKMIHCDRCHRDMEDIYPNNECLRCGSRMCYLCVGEKDIDICIDCEQYGFGW